MSLVYLQNARPAPFAARLPCHFFDSYTLPTYSLYMNAIFVESSLFEKYRANYLSDEQYREVQNELLSDFKKGDVIQATGGLRKVRVASKNKGKRGGARIIYFYLHSFKRFYLLTIYAKNEVSDLTSQEKKQLKLFVEEWVNEQT